VSEKDDAEKLDALVRALFPDDATAPAEDVRAFLNAVGAKRDALRARVRGAVEQLATRERRANSAPPPYMRSVIEACKSPLAISADPATAAAQAKSWVAGFQLPPIAPPTLRFAAAFRGGEGSRTEADERALEQLRDELRRELGGDEDEPKGD
jgi:hypothetical protein